MSWDASILSSEAEACCLLDVSSSSSSMEYELSSADSLYSNVASSVDSLYSRGGEASTMSSSCARGSSSSGSGVWSLEAGGGE